MPTSILQTKLYPPQPRPDLVPRARLIDTLNAGRHRKLTLVSAPAGFGKTTLISDWLQQIDLPFAWLSLDKADNDTTHFLTYFVATLQQIDSELGLTVQAVLQSPQPLPIEALITTLINEISTSSTHFALILDDYHVIDAQPIRDALIFLLDHLPPQMHLIVISRADPILPLSRLRVRGEMSEIRAEDLRFSNTETAEYLNERMELDLSLAEIETLTARTEGWVASLQLAALSLRGRQDKSAFVTTFSGVHHYIVDYLVDEVMARLPAEIQQFLRWTAPLDRFCASLCNAVLDAVDSQQTLQYLERANLFLIPLDEERHWYRYHHLFADFLTQRLQESEQAMIPQIHGRASRWYEAAGQMEEAIQQALLAQDFEQAAQLLEQIGQSVNVHIAPQRFLGWIDQLPVDLRQRYPLLCINHAWSLLGARQIAATEAVLQLVESNRNLAPNSPIDGYLLTIRSFLAIGMGDLDQAATLARAALVQMAQIRDNGKGEVETGLSIFVHQGAATISLANTYMLRGDSTSAAKFYRQAIPLTQKAGSIYALLGAYWNLGDIELMQGRLHRAVVLYEEGLAEAQQWAARAGHASVPVLPAQDLHLKMGIVLYERNELAEAERHLQRALDLFELSGTSDRIEAYTMLAYLSQALGGVEAAVSWIQKARSIEDEFSFYRSKRIGSPTLTQLYLMLGRLDVEVDHYLKEVADWVNDFDIPTGAATGDAVYSHDHLLLARALIAFERADEAIPLLERLLAVVPARGHTGEEIHVLVVHALALQANDEIKPALVVLNRALALAQPEGYIRLFVDEASPMQTLLAKSLAHGAAPSYVTHLLGAFNPLATVQTSEPDPNQLLIEPLSDRELELLHLVANGRSNQEIANELFLAVGTVKKHLNNIFGKLQVSSRTQAVARARELGILSHP